MIITTSKFKWIWCQLGQNMSGSYARLQVPWWKNEMWAHIDTETTTTTTLCIVHVYSVVQIKLNEICTM